MFSINRNAFLLQTLLLAVDISQENFQIFPNKQYNIINKQYQAFQAIVNMSLILVRITDFQAKNVIANKYKYIKHYASWKYFI